MQKVLVVSLALLMVAFAGCADDSPADDLKQEFEEQQETEHSGEGHESEDESEGSGGETGGGTQGEGGEEGEGTEAPEQGTMSISFGANQTVGEAPFTVQFNVLSKAINADGTENEEAVIDWAIFDGENSTSGIEGFGTGRNGTFNFTFTNPGIYEIAAGVTADGFASAFSTIGINVSALPVVEKNPQVASGTYTVTAPIGCALTGGSFYDGVYQGRLAVDPRVLDGDYSVTITGGSAGVVPIVSIAILNAAGDFITTVEGASGVPMTGDIPGNAAHFVFQSCGVSDDTTWDFIGNEP